MVNMAQRIASLRTEANLSQPALSLALGFPRGAIEKFESGRATPTKEQQKRIADHFGVSLFYLRGESNDRTRQEDWIDMAANSNDEGYVPMPAPKPKRPKANPQPQEGAMLDGVLASSAVQDLLRKVVLDTLRSPEGQALIRKAVGMK